MSHIEIKLVADTAGDLSALVAGLHAQLAGEPDVVVVGHIEDEETQATPAVVAKKPNAKPTPAKDDTDEGKAGTTSTGTATEAGASDEPTGYTYADVQKATNALVVKKGRDAALEVLGTFGAKKGQDLTEDQWAGYIDACSLAQGS